MRKEHSSNGPGRAKGRRKFLKNMMLGGGAAAVALITTREAAAQPRTELEAAKRPESKGYRVTPHIEHYYRTAGL
ncbi:MAG: hypothetical protein ACM3NI_01065 [Bacteroidota bacterium]